jgi:hypothetical protein
MFEKIRETLNEVTEIANKCPEKFQLKCFEILLDAVVKAEFSTATTTVSTAAKSTKIEPAFFTQYKISAAEQERIFHFDGKSYSIIVKDLKEKTTAGKQIKLALLLGVKSSLETDKYTISKEELVDICKQYSAYDQSNFAAHIKKQKNLFISKDKNTWILTVPGQDKAAEVIKELAQ